MPIIQTMPKNLRWAGAALYFLVTTIGLQAVQAQEGGLVLAGKPFTSKDCKSLFTRLAQNLETAHATVPVQNFFRRMEWAFPGGMNQTFRDLIKAPIDTQLVHAISASNVDYWETLGSSEPDLVLANYYFENAKALAKYFTGQVDGFLRNARGEVNFDTNWQKDLAKNASSVPEDFHGEWRLAAIVSLMPLALNQPTGVSLGEEPIAYQMFHGRQETVSWSEKAPGLKIQPTSLDAQERGKVQSPAPIDPTQDFSKPPVKLPPTFNSGTDHDMPSGFVDVEAVAWGTHGKDKVTFEKGIEPQQVRYQDQLVARMTFESPVSRQGGGILPLAVSGKKESMLEQVFATNSALEGKLEWRCSAKDGGKELHCYVFVKKLTELVKDDSDLPTPSAAFQTAMGLEDIPLFRVRFVR